MTRQTPDLSAVSARPGWPECVAVPRLLLPSPGTDLYRWSVVACDQYTASEAYWAATAGIVGNAPSTLQMILPEFYLEHDTPESVQTRIRSINRTMHRYLDEGVLQDLPSGCMLIERRTPLHDSRLGLVLCIDLEHYDYTPGNACQIRATEGTVVERIPPRAAIRKDAPLELPHIQLLIDDPQCQVIEPIHAAIKAGQLPASYETMLMQQGGSLSGWFLPESDPLLNQALCALNQLHSYTSHGLLMAVGDGNHSLATAKAHWQALRSQTGADHPARHALVEVINLHDPGLAFEPIHRVVAGLTPDRFLDAAASWFHDQDLQIASDRPDASGLSGSHLIPVLNRDRMLYLLIRRPHDPLLVGSVQTFLDHLVQTHDARIDYIHGMDELTRLSGLDHIGLALPVMSKDELFPCIVRDGILPRKSFSMGEAFEKRYYMECRRIC